MQHLVVARHREDLSWLERVPERWQPLVIEKDVDLPNAGREASSYLHAFQRLYPDLADEDLVCCVQGNPLPHCPALFGILGMIAPTRFHWLGHWKIADCDRHGNPHHPGLPVGEMYERWIGRPWPGNVSFTAGAQFVATGREILGYPVEKYAWLQEEMSQDKAPWVMERLWEQLLSDPKGTTWQ